MAMLNKNITTFIFFISILIGQNTKPTVAILDFEGQGVLYTENLNKDNLHAQSIPDGHHGLCGLTDDGIETFHYFVDGKCIGIKRHKDKNGVRISVVPDILFIP